MVKFFVPIEINVPLPIRLLGIAISVLGLLLITWANYFLLVIYKIGLKDREPYGTPTSLAVTGPYQFTRNPIYLGVLVPLLGTAILFRSLTIIIIDFLIYLLFRYKFIS